MATLPLYGRESELGVLDELTHRVSDHGGALVVRGEAGIEKSAALRHARDRASARGMTILTATGVQSEAHLPFAGLHQLLRPLLAHVDELPAPQRAALQAAFGLSDDAAPDLFLIALATLDLLGDAAERSPLLLLAEDGQWLDRATSDILAFVARRLDSEPVVLLIASRDGCESPFDDAGLPELRLGALDESDAGALLDAHAPGLSASVRARLLDDSAGNPLALVELPAALDSELLVEARRFRNASPSRRSSSAPSRLECPSFPMSRRRSSSSLPPTRAAPCRRC